MDIVAKNLKTGDAFPPRADLSVLRIYSYQTCPFAERSLLVLSAKHIEHEIINVNLREKPEWLFHKNPVGKVPVIEFDSDNKIITESLIVSEYLDETYSSGRQLRASDPYQRARDKMFIELIGPNISVYGKALHSKDDISVLWTNAKESLKKGEELLKQRKTGKFLSGDAAPGLTDYMIWPFIERIPIAIEILSETKADDYIRKELPTIHEYRQQMLSDSTVKKVSLDFQVLLDFSKAVRQLLVHSN